MKFSYNSLFGRKKLKIMLLYSQLLNICRWKFSCTKLTTLHAYMYYAPHGYLWSIFPNILVFSEFSYLKNTQTINNNLSSKKWMLIGRGLDLRFTCF